MNQLITHCLTRLSYDKDSDKNVFKQYFKKKTQKIFLFFFIQKSDKWFQLKFISGSVNDRNKVGDISYSAYKKMIEDNKDKVMVQEVEALELNKFMDIDLLDKKIP